MDRQAGFPHNWTGNLAGWGVATENKFTLRYEGERISEGLEPHLFVEALRGFADFITTITESVYGSHADTTLKLHRLSEGSLVIEILQHLGEATVSDIVAVAASVRSEVEAVLKLLQHLRGSPPNRMERAEDNRVAVQNNSGQVIYFHRSTVNLVLQSDVGASVERFSRPITEGAAKELEVRLNDEPAGTVQENDADSMVSVAPETHCWTTRTRYGSAPRRLFLRATPVGPSPMASVSSPRRCGTHPFLRRSREGQSDLETVIVSL